MELSDLTSVTAEEPLSSQLDSEERIFVRNLYQFMKDRGTPIERIPHLGFKQINLWKIYKAVDILGGYDSVTARRMWKNVYDELGGSPGSTSAATCTRRHYERLVLPFERHRRGEEDKPLPPSKPRKQYKRSEESKSKGEPKKRRRTTEDDETNLRGSHHTEHMCAHSASWPAGHPDGDRVSPQDLGLREKHLLQPLSPALVISPLEKKKRLAQASLNVAIALGLEEGNEPERPSVIQLSHSATPSSRVSNASEGSPLPLSSPSSRSPSPFSVSSEDCVAVPAQKIHVPDAEKPKPTNFGSASLSEPANGVRLHHPLPHGRPSNHKDQSFLSRAQYHNFLHISPAHHDKSQKHPGFRLHVPTSHASACWLPPPSSFTKFVPRSVDPWRPVSLQPQYKPHIPLPKRPNSTETHTKKISTPFVFPDRKEKTKMVVPKPIPTAHQYLVQPGLPVPYLLPSFDRHRPDAAEHLKTLPLHPIFLPAQLGLPSSQPHPAHPLQVGPTFHGSYDAALRQYPYPMQVWTPSTGYSMAALQPF